MHFGAWAFFFWLFSHKKKGTATLTVPFIYAVANSVHLFNIAFSMTTYPF